MDLIRPYTFYEAGTLTPRDMKDSLSNDYSEDGAVLTLYEESCCLEESEPKVLLD